MSEVRTAVTSNLLTQLFKKVAAQLAVEVLTKGTASAHSRAPIHHGQQVSIASGRGRKRSHDVDVDVREVLDRQLYGLNLCVTVVVTFPLAHLWQSLQKLAMSAPMPFHT
jgi:hypothetical protein